MKPIQHVTQVCFNIIFYGLLVLSFFFAVAKS